MICSWLNQLRLLIHHDISSGTEIHKCHFAQNMDCRFCLKFIVTAQGGDFSVWPMSTSSCSPVTINLKTWALLLRSLPCPLLVEEGSTLFLLRRIRAMMQVTHNACDGASFVQLMHCCVWALCMGSNSTAAVRAWSEWLIIQHDI